MVGVINFIIALAEITEARPNQPQHKLCSVSCTGRVRWLLRGFVCLWNTLRGKADC